MLQRRMCLPMIVLAFLALLTVGCGREPHGRKVTLSAIPQRERPLGPESRAVPVRIAIAPVISPKENVGLYRPLLTYVGSQLSKPVDLLQRNTYAEVNDLIRYGHADVAFVCDYAFVEGERDFGMQILVVPTVMGKQAYQSYVIVPQESAARNIFDLKDKSFAFSDPLSSSGYLFPTHLLRQDGQKPESFFRRHIFTFSHDNTVKAVAQRLVDGGAVDSLVYEYMLMKKDAAYDEKTKVIQESDHWGNPPVVVHPRIDPALREQLRRIFLTIHESDEGQKVLKPLMIDRFTLPDNQAYDQVRRMADEARGHIGDLRRARISTKADVDVQTEVNVP